MKRGIIPKRLEACIPFRFLIRLEELMKEAKINTSEINEIRLRVGRASTITCSDENMIINEPPMSAAEMRDCISSLCGGSVYAHEGTIKKGYISIGGGIRVGVCGGLACDGRSLSEITSLNIRIPHAIRGVCGGVLDCCQQSGRVRSQLIYSPPGVGKTTVLRELASRLSGELRLRVVLIDTRGELYMEEMFKDTMCDVISGYPKGKGIEAATGFMSPQVLICDELGDLEEAQAILSAANSGIPIIACAHASNTDELLRRPNIRLLHDNCIFEGYIGLSREYVNGRMSRSFICGYTSREEASNTLCRQA